jgi:GNAT superfamily N-acetyltransferase
MRLAQRLRFRPRRPEDDTFMLSVGRRVFARWSRDPARSLASMLASKGARAEIVERDGAPLGFAIVTFARLRRPYGPWREPAVARLDAIAVTPREQSAGVGRALTRRAEAIAREEGAVVMTLMTAEGNAKARRLFSRAGYLAVIRMPDSYVNGDAAIEMFKPV